MRCLSLLVLATVATAAPQGLGGMWDALKSALTGEEEEAGEQGYETVPYTVVKKYDGYEERTYPSVTWACTEATYDPMEEGGDGEYTFINAIRMMTGGKKSWKNRPSSKMFMRLFRYIAGLNEQGQEVEMTTPVLTQKTPGENGMITSDMCFYMEKKFQSNPPTPIDDLITIRRNKEMTVFVHQFGGYAMQDSVWMREAANFEKKLKADRSDQVDFSTYFTAGYDSPMKFWNRRNEVMFQKIDSNNENEDNNSL